MINKYIVQLRVLLWSYTQKNSVAVKRLEIFNMKILFDNRQVRLFLGKKLIGLENRNNQYNFKFKLQNPDSLNKKNRKENSDLWH